MAGDKDAGWLNSLGALWNGESLEAWIAKLIGVVIVLLVMTTIAAWFQRRSAGVSKIHASGARSRLAARAAPSKNRKKKQDKIVRRYRPRSHDGKKPLRRSSHAEPAKRSAAGTAKPANLWRSSPPQR
jgi:type VI protein secretion system component VasK